MPVTPEKAFGNVVRKLRLKRKLSQEALSFESGYHRTFVSQLERGLKSPTLGTIFQIAAALKVHPSRIVREVELVAGTVTRRVAGLE